MSIGEGGRGGETGVKIFDIRGDVCLIYIEYMTSFY
jgi:hypothetical protein